jgi:hypothetical protein
MICLSVSNREDPPWQAGFLFFQPLYPLLYIMQRKSDIEQQPYCHQPIEMFRHGPSFIRRDVTVIVPIELNAAAIINFAK